MFFKKDIIFMDYASGTPIDKSVLKEMNKFFSNNFFNPGSIYSEGVYVKSVLEDSRRDIAEFLSARPKEIIFTEGGTEANNLVIRGLVSSWNNKNKEGIPHIITSKIEHSSILKTCIDLENKGIIDVDYINVNSDGVLDTKELKNKIRKNTILVSIGYVNGEIGIIQDVRSIAKSIRHYRKINKSELPYFHTDAVQATNYLDINVQKLGVDFMTINGSKIYGPKKIAILYKKLEIKIDPIITGGEQEFGFRAGTENIPYIVGLSKALSVTRSNRKIELSRLKKLQEYMETLLVKNISNNFIINGNNSDRIPNIVNLSIDGLPNEEIVLRLDAKRIKVSVKSACNSGDHNDSHVIKSLRDLNTQSIRFSFGRNTTRNDIDYVVKTMSNIINDMNKTKEKYL